MVTNNDIIKQLIKTINNVDWNLNSEHEFVAIVNNYTIKCYKNTRDIVTVNIKLHNEIGGQYIYSYESNNVCELYNKLCKKRVYDYESIKINDLLQHLNF